MGATSLADLVALGNMTSGPLYAFHLEQIISTVLGQVDHGGQDGNAARTRIRDETDHTQIRRFCHSDICQTITALAIVRCLYGSEMVLLGVVIRKSEGPIPLIFLKKMDMAYS